MEDCSSPGVCNTVVNCDYKQFRFGKQKATTTSQETNGTTLLSRQNLRVHVKQFHDLMECFPLYFFNINIINQKAAQ